MYTCIALEPQRVVEHWDTGYENDKVPDIEAEAESTDGRLHVFCQEAARKINSLDIVLRQQVNLKALKKKRKLKNLGKLQWKAMSKL